jgi:uncharacterized membrane protein YedE/YeeE
MAGHQGVVDEDERGSLTSGQKVVDPDVGVGYSRGLPTAALMGTVFGFLFEKSHVYEPTAIRGQFNFEKWIMIKMFMGAVAGSCTSFALLSIFFPAKFAAVRAGFHPVQRGYVGGGAAGGAILGAGMAIAGACPGMVLPQVGTGVENALFTTGGGLLGALVFGLLEPVLRPALLDRGSQCAGDSSDFLDVKLGKPFLPLCIVLGLCCGGFSLALEILVEYNGELNLDPATNSGFPALDAKAWPPALCGLLLGCLQIPAGLLIGDSLGSSSSYQCIACQWLHLAPVETKTKFTYASRYVSGLGAWWQVFYVGCAILGSYISARLSDTFPATASGVSIPTALIGGFLMLFGSRLGGGCTSGHGISGMPLLNLLSVVAVCSMFGAAIVVGGLMDVFDVLEIPPLVGRF